MESTARPGIGDLIVILEKADEPAVRMPGRIAATRLLLPRIPLPLIEEVLPRHDGELMRRALIVGEIRLAPPRQRNDRGVVPVLVPDAVDTGVVLAEPHKRGVLVFAFGGEIDTPRCRRRTRMIGQFVDDVRRRSIDERMRGIEAKAVKAGTPPASGARSRV